MAHRKKTLFLGPPNQKMHHFLVSLGDEVVAVENNISENPQVLDGIDFIVSYGYRFIIRSNVVDQFKSRVINLHGSLLPWNRGADPNLWSFLEDTPKGVSIHYIDSGIDTGDIIAQREIFFPSSSETLRSTYEKLSLELEGLFIERWADIRDGNIMATEQPLLGTTHKSKDRTPFERLLTRGWDTPVEGLIGKAVGGKK